MSKDLLRVNLPLQVAMQFVKDGQKSDLVHEEILDFGNGKLSGTLIFEKYYFRAENRAALIVLFDNLKDYTEIRVISTGSTQGIFLKIDWGAADDFASSVRKTLKNHLV
ncbi:MAG: DUF6054 family protein [Gudongella sp.]|jgi:hypothetical protein|nr:DUF6054 family protein [Gudongella sp.]